ncbi:hypothetical protein BDZ89DRAFT_1140789 [Hymenopellis radicata]|nr:hypothetical protein BDZ89DRAFT_1140789 [Hymenopellis radicata]
MPPTHQTTQAQRDRMRALNRKRKEDQESMPAESQKENIPMEQSSSGQKPATRTRKKKDLDALTEKLAQAEARTDLDAQIIAGLEKDLEGSLV